MTLHMPSRWYEPRDPDDTDEARDAEADAREQHEIDKADARREDEILDGPEPGSWEP